MNNRISFRSLSKYRTQFMGLAIIFVMLCHNTVKVPEGVQTIRHVVSAIFQSGVDVFMLLSGLGLYYSFRKKPEIRSFLKKRLVKILIPYIIVVIGYAFIHVWYMGRTTLAAYLWDASLISFFIDGAMRIWFVAAIILLYFLYPLLHKILQRTTKGFVCMILGIVAGCLIISYCPVRRSFTIVNELFVSRIPAFLTGMLIAKGLWSEQSRSVKSGVVWIGWGLSLAMIMWIILLAPENWWAIVRLLFLPFTLSGMLLLGQMMDRRGKEERSLRKLCSFLGGITFELYLLHEKVLETLNEFLYLFHVSPILLSVRANIMAILIAVLGAWILNKVVEFLTKHTFSMCKSC